MRPSQPWVKSSCVHGSRNRPRCPPPLSVYVLTSRSVIDVARHDLYGIADTPFYAGTLSAYRC